MTWLIGAFLAVAVAPASFAQEPAAANKPPSIVLPATSLDRTLDQIARISGKTIHFDVGKARTIRAPQIRAEVAEQAVQQALAGTGLTMASDSDGSIVVGQTSVTDLTKVVVTASRNEAETSYSAQTVSSATRDGASLRDQPQSTTIVTAMVIDDQQIQSVTDALRNVSGATVSGSVQGPQGYTIRGNVATATSGGLQTPLGNQQPAANLERIEVLKGPAAVLSGSGNLGGVVNIVTKRPIASRLFNIDVEGASYGERKITLDASNAIDPDKRFSARLVTEYDDASGSPAGYDGTRTRLLAPSLRYKVATTDVVVGASYSDVSQPGPRFGTFIVPGTITRFPRQLGPDDTAIANKEKRVYFDASHEIADGLTLVSRGTRGKNTLDLDIYAPVFYPSPTTAGILKSNSTQDADTTATDTYARYKFATGPFENTLVAGYAYSKFVTKAYSSPGTADYPVFQVVPGFRTANLALQPFRNPSNHDSTNASTQEGMYAQELMEVGQLHVSAGIRKSNYLEMDRSRFGSTRYVYHATTPNAGVVYDITPDVAVYANYLRGFVPSFGTTSDGSLLPPTRSTNVEVGTKADFFDGALSTVASYYRLRQSNTFIYDPTTGTTKAGAGLQSKGLELDIRGQLLPGWQILSTFSHGSYVYLDPVLASTPVVAQPRTRYSLFTSYVLQKGTLKGLGAAIGVYGNSESVASVTSTGVRNIVPAARELDLNFYYGWARSRLNLGIKNLTDRDNYNTTSSASYVVLKDPRTYRLTYSLEL